MESNGIDRFQIVGFAISTAIAVALIIAQQDTVASVTLGTALAILTELIDLQIRGRGQEERILLASALSQHLYRDPELLDRVRQIVDDYRLIQQGSFDLFKRHADTSLNTTRNVLRLMADGQLNLPYRSPDTYPMAFNWATSEVNATQMADATHWLTSYGQQYLRANADAVARGVTVRRVFVQRVDTIPGLGELLARQREAGVQVYLAQPEDLPPELHEDFLIVDNKVLITTL